MDVRIETIGHWLQEFNERFRVVVRGLDAEALAYAPAPETNSIAVLARHAVLTQRGMMAGLTGETFRRDLPSEFIDHPATADELIALLDDVDQKFEEFVDLVTPEALSALYQRPHDQVLTGGEWAVHTCCHVKEHVAHAELTRQLVLARG